MFSPASRARSAAADIFALVVYSFIVGMLIEVFISGMSFNQSLSSRLLSILVNILIAWPYGVYRDWFIRQSQRCRSKGMAKILADLIAYVSFQSPVYAIILWYVGADGAQIMAAVTSNAVVSMAMGVAYGYFLDYCRRLFKVSGYIKAQA